MINENLLVNSKTDILEFKRKHNLLVGKGTIKTTVSNIKQLTNADIENLSCGDVVLKEDESGKHAYLVSFKSDTGLCLTYCDASCVETQSYDKVGDNWAYNSEDKWEMTKPVYCHPITLIGESGIHHITMLIFNNIATPFANFDALIAHIRTWGLENARIMASGVYKASETVILVASYLSVTADTIKIIGNYASDGTSNSYDVNDSSFSIFVDAVNKIN